MASVVSGLLRTIVEKQDRFVLNGVNSISERKCVEHKYEFKCNGFAVGVLEKQTWKQ